jgi:hypothetical protein
VSDDRQLGRDLEVQGRVCPCRVKPYSCVWRISRFVGPVTCGHEACRASLPHSKRSFHLVRDLFLSHGRHCIVHFDPFSDPHWNGKAYRVLAGSSSNAYNKYESGSCAEHMLSSIGRVRYWPDSLEKLLNLDRIVKASILA